MRRNLTLAAGLLLFAIAWFLPVHEHGKTLPQTLPGWQAFLVALSPDWHTQDLAHSYAAALSVASALTNLLVVILVFAWRTRRERLIQFLGWACVISLGLNAQWFLDIGSGLRLGYYCWWLSFGVLGLACLLPVRKPAPTPKGKEPTMHLGLSVLLASVLLATSGCMSANLVTGKAMKHYEIDPETQQDKQVQGRPAYYALLPLTVAGDIATSPFQLLYLCYTLDGDFMVWGPWP
jgi:hypothetical protein